MNIETLNKITKIIIYTLIIFLISLILYNLFLVLNKSYYSNEIPKNSIQVSPISGEKISSVVNMNNIYRINFKNLPIDKIPSILNASIVYDHYDEKDDITSYSALFLDSDFTLDNSMLTVSSIMLKDIPIVSFIDSSKLKDYSYINPIDSILITNSNNSFSNFFYYHGYYHHFTKSIEDTDQISNKHIEYNNIVIDVSSIKENKLYVFSGGLFKEFNKDETLYLSNGKTFWCILNKNSSINLLFSNLENKM